MRFHSKRRAFLLFSLVLIGLAVSVSSQDFEKIPIQKAMLTEGVAMLIGAGGNIGVSIGEDGVLLVDSQFSEMAEKIKAAVAEAGGKRFRFILNTNWHYDHSSGNEHFAGLGAVVIAHENTRRHMMTEWTAPELAPDLKIPPYPKAALPMITVRDSFTIHFNGDEIEAIHMPNAHSDGDLAFHFKKANVIHTGDLFFSNGFPFINITSGGSINGMIQAAEKIIGLINAGTKVIPGHGPLSDRAGLIAYRDMLAEARNRIAKLVGEGKTLEEAIAAKPAAGLYKGGESGFPADIFVRVVYQELAKKAK